MTLDKKLVDEVIRLTKKYYKTGDVDYFPKLNKAKEVLEESVSWQVVDLIEDLARHTQISGKGTYDDIYKALAVFGIIVEEKEFIIHPGETLKEVLEDRNYTQKELAIRTGFSAKHISEVINGKKNISALMAKKLEYALEIPASFWNNLQRIYDEALNENEKELENDKK